nr:MAG TPA: hypothetical protein [Crassvirales sp.]
MIKLIFISFCFSKTTISSSHNISSTLHSQISIISCSTKLIKIKS